jgi:ATP synthase protein I
MPKDDSGRSDFISTIGKDEKRKLEARRRKPDSVWFGLGMLGLVGWSIAVPTLIGVFIGHWLDGRYVSGISWTLTLMLTGLIIGCLNAYYWVKKELQKIHMRENDE